MTINALASPANLYVTQTLARNGSAAPKSPSASSSPVGDSGAGIQTADFSSMTKKEMRDWVNTQIRSGKMSLDESTPFVSMTLDMPVDGSSMVSSTFDTKKVNFYDVLKQGIAGAQSRHDDSGKAELEKALDIIQRNQGSVSSVNVLA